MSRKPGGPPRYDPGDEGSVDDVLHPERDRRDREEQSSERDLSGHPWPEASIVAARACLVLPVSRRCPRAPPPPWTSSGGELRAFSSGLDPLPPRHHLDHGPVGLPHGQLHGATLGPADELDGVVHPQRSNRRPVDGEQGVAGGEPGGEGAAAG